MSGGARCFERRQIRLEIDLCNKLDLASGSLEG
jgi:hypothetical protein